VILGENSDEKIEHNLRRNANSVQNLKTNFRFSSSVKAFFRDFRTFLSLLDCKSGKPYLPHIP